MEVNVIKVGGAVVETPESRGSFLKAFAALPGNKILVHGGGRTATAMASRIGLQTVMEEGRRVTDASMLEVVTMVYGGLVNKTIVSELQALGVNAIGLTGADLGSIISHKRPLVQVGGRQVDYGFVGDVDAVNADVFVSLADLGAVPVVAPLSYSREDGLLNTNADTIATEIAKALSATLTFCFEKLGVLSDPDNDDSLIKEIDIESYLSLKAEGVISGGMIPKLDNAFSALRGGVSRVVITSASTLEEGSGTRVSL